MAQDGLSQTKQDIDPMASRDAAWEHFERLRDPSRGAGLDEEELFGGLGESAGCRGLFITPNPSRQTL
jgi:hypothetical protein